MAEYVISEKGRRAVTRLVRGKMAATVPPAPAPAVIGYDQYLAPYTVRWSQSQESGTGAWVIWLPDTSKLLMYASSYITPGSISPAASLPPGFYTITDLPADATSVWLVVHIPDQGSGRFADFAASPGTAETGETIYNILVATMTTDSETGAKWVKQLVDSAITLGARGGASTPDNISLDSGGQNNALQVHNWTTGQPVAAQTIAADLSTHSGTPSGDMCVVRTPDGVLKYKPIGELVEAVPLDTSALVVYSVDYIMDTGDPDFAAHPYAIRIKRGNLQYANNRLTIAPNANATQFIDTIPLSSEMTV